jgi:hypothetical protein
MHRMNPLRARYWFWYEGFPMPTAEARTRSF